MLKQALTIMVACGILGSLIITPASAKPYHHHHRHYRHHRHHWHR